MARTTKVPTLTEEEDEIPKMTLEALLRNIEIPPEPSEDAIKEMIAKIRLHPRLPGILKKYIAARHEPTGAEMLLPHLSSVDTSGFTIIDDYATVERIVAKLMLDGKAMTFKQSQEMDRSD